jgi:hypothetical protein
MSLVRANISITAYEGTTFNRLFRWKTGESETPVDLTGYTAVCHIRERISSEDTVFELTTENGGLVIEDQVEDTGKYRLVIAKEELQGICENHRDERFVYDLMLIDSDGNTKVQQYGDITIKPVVTRPWT